jgi:adenylate cyclase
LLRRHRRAATPASCDSSRIRAGRAAAQASATASVYIPVGTAIHTGEAFVGATSPGTTVDDFTALDDAVNIAARLASSADAGEVIVSVAAAEAADIATEHLERRTVEIRVRTEPIEIIVVPTGRQNESPDEHRG